MDMKETKSYFMMNEISNIYDCEMEILYENYFSF